MEQLLSFNMQFDQIMSTIFNNKKTETAPNTTIGYKMNILNSTLNNHHSNTNYGGKDLSKKSKLQCLVCKQWGHIVTN